MNTPVKTNAALEPAKSHGMLVLHRLLKGLDDEGARNELESLIRSYAQPAHWPNKVQWDPLVKQHGHLVDAQGHQLGNSEIGLINLWIDCNSAIPTEVLDTGGKFDAALNLLGYLISIPMADEAARNDEKSRVKALQLLMSYAFGEISSRYESVQQGVRNVARWRRFIAVCSPDCDICVKVVDASVKAGLTPSHALWFLRFMFDEDHGPGSHLAICTDLSKTLMRSVDQKGSDNYEITHQRAAILAGPVLFDPSRIHARRQFAEQMPSKHSVARACAEATWKISAFAQGISDLVADLIRLAPETADFLRQGTHSRHSQTDCWRFLCLKDVVYNLAACALTEIAFEAMPRHESLQRLDGNESRKSEINTVAMAVREIIVEMIRSKGISGTIRLRIFADLAIPAAESSAADSDARSQVMRHEKVIILTVAQGNERSISNLVDSPDSVLRLIEAKTS